MHISHLRLIVIYIFSPGCHNQSTKSSDFRAGIQNAELRVFLSKAPQAMKEITDDCDKVFWTPQIFLFIFSNYSHLS